MPQASSLSQVLRLVLFVGLTMVGGLAGVQAQVSSDAKEAQRLARVAQVAQQEGRLGDAVRAYQTIAVVAKGSPTIAANAHLSAGNIYMSLGKFEEAAAAFRRSLSLDPNSAEAQNNLGEALGELKQYQRALEAFQRAVALDSRFLKARYNMGVTYDRLGQLKYAEFVYRILVRDFPDFVLAYDSLAVTLSKSGRAREAIAFHEKAIRLDAQEPSFYYNFALSYLVLGDLKRAREQQQKLRNLDPAMGERLAAVIARRK
jgi:tetratricopeptide (TPR) repeat protein